MGQESSYVITVLFNTKDKTFLGRGGKWQSANEFVSNPPAKGREIAKDPRQSSGDGKTDPGGQWLCDSGILYWCEENAAGGFDKYDCGPCPW